MPALFATQYAAICYTYHPRSTDEFRIDHFIADFYSSKCRLVIEIDGCQHYTPEGLIRDAIRTDVLAMYGLKAVRFTNDNVIGQFDAVCREIDEWLKQAEVSYSQKY